MLTAFAGCAFALPLIGLVGVVSPTVVRRRRELGIHLAMGATPRQVVRLTIWRTVRLTLIGCGIGLTAALIASRGLVGALHGIATLDLLTIAGGTVLFAVVAVMAAYVPARRATRLDVVSVLRDL